MVVVYNIWCINILLSLISVSFLKVHFGFRMKIAVIGQSLFGQEVYKELRKEGHTIVGVFTIPDKDGKADPLGETLIPLYSSYDVGITRQIIIKAFRSWIRCCRSM